MTNLINKELLEQIKPLLKDDSSSVRDSASNALGSIVELLKLNQKGK